MQTNYHTKDAVKQTVKVLYLVNYPSLKWTNDSRPESHGEEHFIIIVSALHIKRASLKMFGDLLDGSECTGALVQSGIATPGFANFHLKVFHVTYDSILQLSISAHTSDISQLFTISFLKYMIMTSIKTT